MENTPKRVALGMSGGVDSSLAAHLLVEAGYEVTGVYLECWRAPGCRTDQDRADALKVALSLNIPFQVLDFKDAYKNKVVENFFSEYQAGRTPNPDVLCNKEIKFGLFYDWAMENNFDFVATGHYAQNNFETGTLLAAKDTHKDQTYFLYRLTQNHLTHTLFPVGHLTKPEVRVEATKRNIPVATKKDSVGICFIGDINVHHFLKERLGENPGEVVDVAGTVIGSHKGLWFYTIGQRHGFEVTAKSKVTNPDGSVVEKDNIPPFYVIEKRPETNQLVVGFGAQTYKHTFTLTDLHWINSTTSHFEGTSPQLFTRIRHTGELHPATFDPKTSTITTQTPIKGVASGQSAVLYIGTLPNLEVIGGGVIA